MLVAAIIVVAVVSYGYVRTSSSLSALSQQNTSLSQQVIGLNQQLSNLYQQNANLNQQVSAVSQQESALASQNSNLGIQVAGLNQQLSGLNQQVSNLNQQVSTLEQQTMTVVTETNTIVSVQTTKVSITSTVTSISAVPQSALVVIGDSYDTTNHIFSFQVQNTQNYTIYAQLSASLWGGGGGIFCNGQAGSFISQVYTFTPKSITTTTLDLTLGQWAGYCGGNPVSSTNVNYVIPQSTAVSPTYTFNIVPNYNHP